MVVPSYRHRAGKVAIENRQRQIKEEQKKLEDNFKQNQKPVSKEEHEGRLKKLKELGLLK